MTNFILTDIESTSLSQEDREILQHPALFGLLLFSRNYESREQLRELCRSIHASNHNLIIAVDQEGGRVQRFTEDFTPLQAMGYWGKQFDQDPQDALEGIQQQTQTMVKELQACGVQVSLAPVLDIDYERNTVIGERSFHRDPMILTQLADRMISTMHQSHMPSLGKHFPGHGAVRVDSHQALPSDNRSWETLWEYDMLPYRQLLSKLDAIMPAHIVFEKMDKNPIPFSRHWIQTILRKKLQYDGLIITDDLTMGGAATIGSYEDRARFALEAGCDILTIANSRKGLCEVLDTVRNTAGKYSHELRKKRVLKYKEVLNKLNL